jgi:hypothetical protein
MGREPYGAFRLTWRLLVQVGDLVRRRTTAGGTDFTRAWLALVIEIKESNGYIYPRFMILDTGKINSCSGTLLEVISENR